MIPDIIFIAAGQSNEVGRAKVSTMPSWQYGDRIFMLTKKKQWVTAQHPTHWAKASGGGPTIYSAEVLAEAYPDKTIGIVPCAVNGSGIKLWVERGKLFENCLKTSLGLNISGVIFYQGEEDAKNAKLRALWPDRLVSMVEAFRRRLAKPSLPFVYTQLCHSVKNEAQFDLMRVVQASALSRVPQPCAMVDARVEGATLIDNNHLDGATYRSVGILQGEALRDML